MDTPWSPHGHLQHPPLIDHPKPRFWVGFTLLGGPSCPKQQLGATKSPLTSAGGSVDHHRGDVHARNNNEALIWATQVPIQPSSTMMEEPTMWWKLIWGHKVLFWPVLGQLDHCMDVPFPPEHGLGGSLVGPK